MLGGIDNGLFLSSFGGFFALGILALILKWAFGNRGRDKNFVIGPDKAGKKDQYGLLVPLPTPKNYIEAEMLKQKLINADIRVNLTQTLEGPALMVFEKDLKIAQAVLKS
jgi:hypothetical protein